jgi:hypothetical protein
MTKKTAPQSQVEASPEDLAYTEFVWQQAGETDMYKTILYDLIFDAKNAHRVKSITAKNADDFARVEIGTNFL